MDTSVSAEDAKKAVAAFAAPNWWRR